MNYRMMYLTIGALCAVGTALAGGPEFRAKALPTQLDGSELSAGAVQARHMRINTTTNVVKDQNLQIGLAGGEACGSATVIAGLPYTDTGDTTGAVDDYNEVCPFTETGAPDVVYSYTPAADVFVDIDLCSSIMDTKVYVYEDSCPLFGAPGSPIACNDDACGALGFQSLLTSVSLTAGTTYYIVVDGYDAASFGSYTMTIAEAVPPFVPEPCPIDALFSQSADGDASLWTAGTSEAGTGFARLDDFAGVTAAIEGVSFYGLELFFDGAGFVACPAADSGEFEITFYADAGGTPGAVVCTEIVTAIRTVAGGSYNGFEVVRYDATLTTACGLTDGWISIVGMGDPTCYFLWMSSGEAGNGSSLLDNSGVLEPDDFDLNFCLLGSGSALLGSCCDGTAGGCVDDVLATDCTAPGSRFSLTPCAQLDPPCGSGACCFSDGSECVIITEFACQSQGGTWLGDNTSCDDCPFVLVCPPNGLTDGEPDCFDGYVDTTNGGCNSDPNNPPATAINCGDTYCGTSGNYLPDPLDPETVFRDTDWYVYTATGDEELTWTVSTSVATDIFIVDGTAGCADATIIVGETALAQTETSITACVPAGTYYLFVGANDAVAPCSSPYVATLTCASCVVPRGACCLPIGDCLGDLTESECNLAGGTWQGEGVLCDPNPCPVPPDNDNCDSAKVITAPFMETVDTSLATTGGPAGSCNSTGAISAGTMDNDVWYQFTPTEDCLATWTAAASYDGVSVLYEGPDCNSLVEIDCIDPDPATFQFNAIAGTTYWLQHGDWGTFPGGGSADISLTCSSLATTGACCLPDGSCTEVNALDCAGLGGAYQGDDTLCADANCPQPNPGDNCASPIVLTLDGTVVTDPNQTTCGRVDDYENTCLGFYDGGEDIIYQLDVTMAGCYQITVDADSIWVGFAVLDGCPISGDPNCLTSAGTSSANPDVDVVTLEVGTYYLMIDTFPAPECADFSLTIEPCPLGACCLPDASCVNMVSADECDSLGGTYQGDLSDCSDVVCDFLLGACCLPDTTCVPDVGEGECDSLGGIFQGVLSDCSDVVCLDLSLGADCNSPIPVTLSSGMTPYVELSQTTCGRGNNYSNTCLGNYDGGEDIIYEITVADDGCYQIVVDADTIWVGAGLLDVCPSDPNAVCIATATTSANPDIIETELTAGTYYLMIDTWPTPNCATFDLTIQECPPPPPGEVCDDAIEILSLPFSDVFDNSVYSADGPAGSCNSSSATVMQNDIWYVWTATADCYLTAAVDPATYDGITAVYSGPDCLTLTEIACADEPEPHVIEFHATAGTTYWFQMGDWGTTPGGGITPFDLDCTLCGDLDGDADVDGDDFTVFMGAYGSTSADANYIFEADYDEDGAVTLVDYQAWLACYRDYVDLGGRIKTQPINQANPVRKTRTVIGGGSMR
jgi:hypothetical protein